jgi:putative hydrolase of the HAD superfamily
MQAGSSETKNELRTVIFDYGEVLCHRPTIADFERMATTLGITLDSFSKHWEQSRPPYDRGDLSAEAYWLKFARDTHTSVNAKQIEELGRWEIEMWTEVNPSMVRWFLDVVSAGMKTGLLSNMPADLAAHVQENFDWMDKFTLRIFSAHVRLVKPDAAIYEHILHALDAKPEETLFVDDREANIKAASALGMRAIQFQSVAQLRNDLRRLDFPVLPASD